MQKQALFIRKLSLADRVTKSATSHLSLLLRIGIAVAACWIIYLKIDPAEVADKFKSLRIWLLIAMASAVFSGGVCLIGLRWWVFMRAQEIRVPAFLAIKLTFLGQFFSNFMPSAVGGDVIRAWYVSRYISKKRLQAALGVLVDRLLGLVATLILAVMSYLLFMRGQGIFEFGRKETGVISAFFSRHPILIHQVVLILVMLVGVFFIAAGIFDLRLFFKRLYGYFIHLKDQSVKVLLVYYHHPLVFVYGILMTLLLQSLVILSLWLVGSGLGISADIQFYFVFFPVIWTIGSIPISIAGIGVLEGGIVFLFVQFTGAEPEAAIALALCQRLTWIVASAPGLAVHLRGTHRHKEQTC
jgi:uncharacterized protein (TIRG00374 family)